MDKRKKHKWTQMNRSQSDFIRKLHKTYGDMNHMRTVNGRDSFSIYSFLDNIINRGYYTETEKDVLNNEVHLWVKGL